jgi:hypothetical protein
VQEVQVHFREYKRVQESQSSSAQEIQYFKNQFVLVPEDVGQELIRVQDFVPERSKRHKAAIEPGSRFQLVPEEYNASAGSIANIVEEVTLKWL